MNPEKRELALAFALGLCAGPCYLVAGPERFLTWYAVVLGGGIFSTAFWLKEISPSKAACLVWLVWPLAMLAGAAASLLVCLAILSKGGASAPCMTFLFSP
ncbi:hypothetical protein [Neomoorella mulderi]|uniref:Uncharacterized protein n=1 Tax=Moorella mulderi DSM 14980 TaxID=1122241 RepID=A0A151ASV9_9FIRM|nr:hypothetical protein [Moorella mulderi]KYH30660.1 hypothetical protein MOMUL_29930 [Moorella mulderi DSM 14980]